jgi:F-type H+-transporting ATPase subunit alpha
VKGFLDTIKVEDISRFEKGLLQELRGAGSAILVAIRTDKQIKPETEEKLKAVLSTCIKLFA